MHAFKKSVAPALAATFLAFTALSAQAQSPGSWIGRVGFTHLSPSVSSGDLTPAPPGMKIDVGNDTVLSGGISYVLTDHLWFDFPLAMPFKHDLTGDGLLKPQGKLADVKVVPITFRMQYRFGEKTAKYRPYVGAGATYAHFYDETPTIQLGLLTGNPAAGLSVESKWGANVQLGLAVALTDRWSLDFSYSKTYLKNRTTLSTGQTIDVRLNPDAYAVGLAYQF